MIKKVSIFVNPFDAELLEEEVKQEAEKEAKDAKEKADMVCTSLHLPMVCEIRPGLTFAPDSQEEFGHWYSNPTGESKQAVFRQGVGKYIHTATLAPYSAKPSRGLGLPAPGAASGAPSTGGAAALGLSLPQVGSKRKSAEGSGRFDFSKW